jgi:hypothetical protein
MTTIISKSDYELKSDGRFVIHHYNQKRPFSNFLPGIAGLDGTPLWVFYVNRGQGIASFGTKNKDNAILEFFPANKAYQNTTTLGFRTFLKITRHGKTHFYEPFRENVEPGAHSVDQSMEISSDRLVIRDIHKSLGLEVTVTYFTVPGEPLAALAREVEFKNISHETLELEVLDGLPLINPYGMNEFFIKSMSRTIEAWMVVENLEKQAPFFKLKVDAADSSEVKMVQAGNFCFYLDDSKLLDVIVDPQAIFGSVLDFSSPKVFRQNDSFKFPKNQISENKTPCAFGFLKCKIAPAKAKTLRSFFGHASSAQDLRRYVSRASGRNYLSEKSAQNQNLIDSIKDRMWTVTSLPAYDFYCGQTYLDNVMRGGMPVRIGSKDRGLWLYVYSRKHGDLERDYNRFLVEPSYLAQGDGNYRDVNQNRRSDTWFEPGVGDANIRTFLNFIQLDGFNPLVIKPSIFHLKRSPKTAKVLKKYLGGKNASEAEAFLSRPFGLGEFFRFLNEKQSLKFSRFEQLAAELSDCLVQEEKAEHGEGFWVDHWTYNLDLIESYLSIFPENRKKILLDMREYTFYDDDHRVVPRAEKYFLKEKGAIRQYRAVIADKEKAGLLMSRDKNPCAVRTRGGRGEIYTTNLFVKLLCLFTNKLSSLDPQGVGIEMEADKPSWYDALNGLPGILGSSLPETFELKRLAIFMVGAIDDLGLDLKSTESLPAELYEFVATMAAALEKTLSSKNSKPFEFWETAASAREEFRRRTFFGLSGKEKKMTLGQIKIYLEHAREKIEMGLEKAFDKDKKIFPTYFENTPERFQKTKKGQIVLSSFSQKALPLFLEGPVHALKVERDPLKKRELFRAVRASGLYDSALSMYKVNDSLRGVSLEIGRACVFAPGWLENESIWLHMEYKWLLEVLKAGMTDEFFEDFKKTLVCFQDSARYGRSILENSSFIVSSAFGDPQLHGGGFVARLSGSTAEFLSMWLLMNVGKRPFSLGPDGKLCLRFEPNLPGFLFTRQEVQRTWISKSGEPIKIKVPKDSLAFVFLGKTIVRYHNPNRLSTFGKNRVLVRKITLISPRGERMEFKGDVVPSPWAQRVRDGLVPKIDIELG